MKKLLVCLFMIGLAGVSAIAAPTVPNACPTEGFALSRLLPGGDLAAGCYDEDKDYYNFAYTPSNGDPVDPELVTVSIGTVQGVFDQHTVNFQAASAWQSPFVLSYTINVNDDNPYRFIFAASLAASTPSVPGTTNTASVSELLDPDMGVNVTLVAPPVSETAALNARLIDVTNTITGVSSASTMTQFSNTFFEQVVPEPGTYAALGTGLLALALLRRKRA